MRACCWDRNGKLSLKKVAFEVKYLKIRTAAKMETSWRYELFYKPSYHILKRILNFVDSFENITLSETISCMPNAQYAPLVVGAHLMIHQNGPPSWDPSIHWSLVLHPFEWTTSFDQQVNFLKSQTSWLFYENVMMNRWYSYFVHGWAPTRWRDLLGSIPK